MGGELWKGPRSRRPNDIAGEGEYHYRHRLDDGAMCWEYWYGLLGLQTEK